MKILISPAKSLDFENEVETSHSSNPLFGKKAKQINNVIKDLSAPDPTSIFNLFGLLPYSTSFLPDFLNIGIWPLLMGVTMFLQQRLNPTPPDPIQAKIFAWMPVAFTFLLATFPAGLVIYWTWNNLLSICQQWVIMNKMNKESK